MIMDQSDIIAELLKEAESKDEGEISRSEIDELKNFIFFLPATTFESIHPPNLLCRFSKYVDISVKHIDDKYSDVTRLKKLQAQLVGCKNTIIKFASKSESYPNSKNHKLKAFHDLLPNKFVNKNAVLLRLLTVLAIREFCCSPNYHSNHGFKLDDKNPIVGNLGERLKNISSYLSTTVVTDEYIRAMFDDNVIELNPAKKLNNFDLSFFSTHVSSLVSNGLAKNTETQDTPPQRQEIPIRPIEPVSDNNAANWTDPLEKINALRHIRKITETLNLPLQKFSLTAEQRRGLVTLINRDVFDSSTSIFAARVMFLIQTCHEQHYFTYCKLSSSEEVIDAWDSLGGVDLISGHWVHGMIALPKRAQAENYHIYSMSNDRIALPLDQNLVAILQKRFSEGATTVEEALNVEPLAFLTYVNGLKLELGLPARQLSEKCLRYLLFSELMERAPACFASLLLATDEFTNPITLYYLSIDVSLAQNLYTDSCRAIGLKPGSHEINNKAPAFGSRLSVDMTAMKTLMSDVLMRLEKGTNDLNPTIATLIDTHNFYASYVKFVLMLCTGHRGSKGVFFDHVNIDFSRHLALIDDKHSRRYGAVRIVPLPPIVMNILGDYRIHLRKLAFALQSSKPDVSSVLLRFYNGEKYGEAPLFSVIEEQGLRAVGWSDIKYYVFDRNEIPSNISRHLLGKYSAVAPTSNALPLILGHYARGQHPLDIYALETLTFDTSFTQTSEALLSALGIRRVQSKLHRSRFKTRQSSILGSAYCHDELAQFEASKKQVYARALSLLRRHNIYKAETIEEIDNTFSAIRHDDKPTEWTENAKSAFDDVVDSFQSIFQRHFHPDKTASSLKTIRRHLKNEVAKDSASVLTLHNAQIVDTLAESFLDLLARKLEQGASSFKRRSGTALYYLSLIIFQPYAIIKSSILTAKQTITLQHAKVADTYYLTVDNAEDNEVIPVNLLSSLVITLCPEPTTMSVNPDDVKEIIKELADISARKIPPNELTTILSSAKKLISFIMSNGVYHHPQLLTTDVKSSLTSTGYSLRYAMLLTNKTMKNVTINVNETQFSNTKEHLKHLTRFDHKSKYDLEKEKVFFKALLKEMAPIKKASDVRTTVFDAWGNYIGIVSNSTIELIKHSNRLSDVGISLLIYAVKLCERTSKHGSGKLIGETIRDYLESLRTPAFNRTQIHATDIFYSDEESLILFYDKLLKNSSRDKVETLLGRVKEFHSALTEIFYIQEIDWTMLKSFRRSNGARQTGIARLVTEDDYQQAILILKTTTSLSKKEILLHLGALCLGYRLGMRELEVGNLLLRHVNFIDWTIQVAPTSNRATKSLNSPRTIPANHLLNEKEKGWLLSIRDIVMKSPKSSSALFSDGIDATRHLPLTGLIKNLNQILRWVTKDDKVRFYDLRHSCINYHLLLCARAYQHRRYETALTKWTRIDTQGGVSARLARLDKFVGEIEHIHLGHAIKIGGTIVYALSRNFGHSHITEREYYMHVLPIISELSSNRYIKSLLKGSAFARYLQQGLEKGDNVFDFAAHVRSQITRKQTPQPHEYKTVRRREHVNVNSELITLRPILNTAIDKFYRLSALHRELVAFHHDNKMLSIDDALFANYYPTLLEAYEPLFKIVFDTNYSGIHLPRKTEERMAYNKRLHQYTLKYFDDESFKSTLYRLLTDDSLEELLVLWRENSWSNTLLFNPELVQSLESLKLNPTVSKFPKAVKRGAHKLYRENITCHIDEQRERSFNNKLNYGLVLISSLFLK
jgi:hypothetical protein